MPHFLAENPGLIDAILEVGRERQQILNKLKSAFENEDYTAALFHARLLVGLDSNMDLMLYNKAAEGKALEKSH